MRRRIFPVLLPALGLFPLLVSCSLIFGSGDEDKKSTGKLEREPTLILSRFVRTSENRQGGREWILKAREARYFEQEHRMFLTDFIVTFYKDGKPSSSLRARRGIIHTQTRDLVARKQVFLQSALGRTLATEELFGNMRHKIVTNAVFNRITVEDGSVLTGTHLFGQNDLKVFKLKNAVGTALDSNLSNRRAKGDAKRASGSD